MRALALALIALAACGAPMTDLGLGKVVIYRSGVAYFERRVRPGADQVTIAVPTDLVDDFLKSMTVLDRASGKPLPISLPSRGNERNGLVEVTVELPASARPRELLISYMTEAPAWKPSYRVRVAADGAMSLEGWAVVDNVSGETWSDVEIGVGSSSALSFRYDLWSIRDVKRQVLGESQQFAVAPPSGGPTDPDRDAAVVVKEVGDSEIAFPSTHQNVVVGRTYQQVLTNTPGVSFGGATTIENSYVVDGVNTTGQASGTSASEIPTAEVQRALRERAEADRRRQRNQRLAETLAAELKSSRRKVVIEGYARSGELDPSAASLDRANVMRNQLVELGVPPGQLEVKAMGSRDGRPAGVRLVAAESTTAAPGATRPVGESHFTAKTPMTVKPGRSVMLAIVNQPVTGELVYVYDPESERGNSRYAFRAIRIANPTDNTLEPGPVTVYGAGRFIGEGLTEPIGPRATAVIPFALDRQIAVERTLDRRDRIAGLAKIERGVLTADIDHRRTTRLLLANRMRSTAAVYIRHQPTKGWTLRSAPKKRERIGDAVLFAVELGPGERRAVEIVETTPLVRRLDLRTIGAVEMLEVYLSGDAAEDGALTAQLAPLLATHREIVDHYTAVDSLQLQLDELRARSGELHRQIVSLRAVKTRGPLIRHLDAKLREVSERVQRGTMEVVDREQKLMLARIRFQDALAEIKR
jgi:hypothetical protein